MLHVTCLLFNILYAPCNFQKTLKTVKGYKCNLEHQNLSCMLLGSIWESATSHCMDCMLMYLPGCWKYKIFLYSPVFLRYNPVCSLSIELQLNSVLYYFFQHL